MSKSEAEPAPPPAAPAPSTRTPEEWSRLTFPPNDKGRQPYSVWKHAAAAALHGWSQHAHHEGAPMQLSAADYAAAIATVTSGGKPHAAALSKHKYVRKPKEQAL